MIAVVKTMPRPRELAMRIREATISCDPKLPLKAPARRILIQTPRQGRV
jgi:hypothetical protein